MAMTATLAMALLAAVAIAPAARAEDAAAGEQVFRKLSLIHI